jgi:hypothetical protein
MEMRDKEQLLENLYREVGDMLHRAKQNFHSRVEDLQELDLVYGGVETIKHLKPDSDAWWREAAIGLEHIRDRLVTITEDELFTH